MLTLVFCRARKGDEVPVYFTKEGMTQYRAKMQEISDKLKAMHGRLGELAEVGGDDWHDNFSYEQQMREIGMYSDDLRRMEEALNGAVIVDTDQRRKDVVTIGATVLVERNGVKKEWQIVGFGESDPNSNKIDYNAPIAQAIMNKGVGESVAFRDSTILIKKIS
jgi:transcription elongation GreA/GreB family factor